MIARKYAIYVILSLFVFQFFSCNKDEEPEVLQVLTNWNMEGGAGRYNDVPRGWYPYAYGHVECAWDTVEFNSPTHSLKISSSDSTGTDVGYWVQQLTYIEHGMNLNFKIKVKAVDLVGQGPVVAVYAFSTTAFTGEPVQIATSEDIIENGQIIGTFDWKTYEVVLENIQDDVKSVYVFFVYRPDTLGDVYFDDAVAAFEES
ncbi:hypothetical protein ACFLU5_16960 [Bacteroidota bacterium]